MAANSGMTSQSSGASHRSLKDGTHELDRKSDRQTLLTGIQTFLAEHLGRATD